MYFYLNSYLNNAILLCLLQIIKRYGYAHVMPKEVRSFVPTQKQKKAQNLSAPKFASGRGSRNRTHNQRFWRPLLYQLSYTPK